jgi:hypothetical protein
MPAFERPSLTPTDRDVLSSQAVGTLRQAYDIPNHLFALNEGQELSPAQVAWLHAWAADHKPGSHRRKWDAVSIHHPQMSRPWHPRRATLG